MAVTVGPPPQTRDVAELTPIIWRILESISSEFYFLRVPRVHSAPIRPQDGQLAYADGSDWNPGSGRGIYRYDATSVAWVFLG